MGRTQETEREEQAERVYHDEQESNAPEEFRDYVEMEKEIRGE